MYCSKLETRIISKLRELKNIERELREYEEQATVYEWMPDEVEIESTIEKRTIESR